MREYASFGVDCGFEGEVEACVFACEGEEGEADGFGGKAEVVDVAEVDVAFSLRVEFFIDVAEYEEVLSVASGEGEDFVVFSVAVREDIFCFALGGVGEGGYEGLYSCFALGYVKILYKV